VLENGRGCRRVRALERTLADPRGSGHLTTGMRRPAATRLSGIEGGASSRWCSTAASWTLTDALDHRPQR
jgi:hypothetical protein